MTHKTLQEIVKQGVKLTPMMRQYYEIKKDFEDVILLFRMGDFYEVFFEDAINASRILNIARTHRGKLGDYPIPMAGIPHHAASAYIDKLTSQGMKVAICEQVQDPKDAVGIVKRAVTQVVSPGLPYEVDKAKIDDSKYIASFIINKKTIYLSLVDFTTGDFLGFELNDVDSFIDKLKAYRPKEIITYMGQLSEDWPYNVDLESFIEKNLKSLKTNLSIEYFNTKTTKVFIEKIIPNYQRDNTLKTFKKVLIPIGALSYYITSTQGVKALHHLKPFQMINNSGLMKTSISTLEGLEILPAPGKGYKDSLIGHIDKCKTAMGSRRLKSHFLNPLKSKKELLKRYTLIENLSGNIKSIETIRDHLTELRDIERILAKITTKKANGADLLNLSDAFDIYLKLIENFTESVKEPIHDLTKNQLIELKKITCLIRKVINDEIGASLEKGNLIKSGYNKTRDKLFRISQNVNLELQQLEETYRDKTGILKLKIKQNNVAGFFIEVSKSHTSKVPKYFDRRQTLVNAERYTTKELSNFEKDFLSSKDKLEKLERQIFNDLISEIEKNAIYFISLAETLSLIDVFQSHAWIVAQNEFTKPIIHSNKKIVNLKGAWHPLIKDVVQDEFVTHDLALDANNFFALITGPNMAGKTTVMREVAIIQFLAQIGSFVPAEYAEIGLCDYIFSRLGASDDILRGQSTFMVEMSETAEIIRHATEKSLIILDEVGRGTSTYDGLSIAWSLVEYFVNKTKALTLFATHYHELIDLIDNLKHAKNLTVETVNKNGDVQFLYRLIEQGASQSYGIYVAKLAGLPELILSRSQELLLKLESSNDNQISTKQDYISEEKCSLSEVTEKLNKNGQQLSFFEEEKPQNIEIPEYLKELEEDITNLDIFQMTPIDALNKLNELKARLPLQ